MDKSVCAGDRIAFTSLDVDLDDGNTWVSCLHPNLVKGTAFDQHRLFSATVVFLNPSKALFSRLETQKAADPSLRPTAAPMTNHRSPKRLVTTV